MIDTARKIKKSFSIYVFTYFFWLSEFIAARNAAIALGVILVLSLAANISLLILLLRKRSGSKGSVILVLKNRNINVSHSHTRFNRLLINASNALNADYFLFLF